MDFILQQLQDARVDIIGGIVSGLVVAGVLYILKVIRVDVGSRRLIAITISVIVSVLGLQYLEFSLWHSVIIVGGIVGAGVCAYYLLARDKSRIHLDRRPPRNYKGPHKYQRWRLLAKSGITAFLVVVIAAFIAHYGEQSRLREKMIILVADFAGPQPEDYKVTETILGSLDQELEQYNYLLVQPLNETITQSEGSRRARS